MAASLKRWRQRNHLTQVDAASLLGVSQTYLSLLEKGVRPITKTLRSRLTTVVTDSSSSTDSSPDDKFRAQLSALGYPPFAHVARTRSRPGPDAFLLSVLSRPDVDPRVAEALPWVIRRYGDALHLPWLLREAKLRNLQNRLGFLLQVAGFNSPDHVRVIAELDQARLLQEGTFCWDSMPTAARNWTRLHRDPLASHWNLLTTIRSEPSANAD